MGEGERERLDLAYAIGCHLDAQPGAERVVVGRAELLRWRAEAERLREMGDGLYRNPGPHTPPTTFLGILPAGYFDGDDGG